MRVWWWIGRLARRYVPLLVLRGILAWRVLSGGWSTLLRVLPLGRILPLRWLPLRWLPLWVLALWVLAWRILALWVLALRGITLLLRPGLLSPVRLLRVGGSSRPSHRGPRLRRVDGGLGLRHG